MNLKDELHARPELAAAIAAGQIDAIAATYSAARTAVLPRFINARTILAECGAIGAPILDALEAAAVGNSAVKWALRFLGQETGLDVGHPATQYMIDQLAAGGALTAAQATALKNLAVQPAPVSRNDVAAALYNDNGSIK